MAVFEYCIVQQHFEEKYSFQRVPNQVEKLRKFQGAGGGGGGTQPLEWKFEGGGGVKQKCPPWGGGYGYFLELYIGNIYIRLTN